MYPASLGLSSVPSRLCVAIPLFFAAFGLGAWGLLTFRRHGASPEPSAVPSTLVTSGPFRFSRNPLYIALVVTLAAFAALLNSLWLLCFVPFLALLLHTLVIPREEARLLQHFGPQYLAYTRNVRRWL